MNRSIAVQAQKRSLRTDFTEADGSKSCYYPCHSARSVKYYLEKRMSEWQKNAKAIKGQEQRHYTPLLCVMHNEFVLAFYATDLE